MTRRDDDLDAFARILSSLAALLTAVTSGALAGHSIGWW
jgi:hypothetical protein